MKLFTLYCIVVSVLPAIIDRLGDGKEQVSWHHLSLFTAIVRDMMKFEFVCRHCQTSVAFGTFLWIFRGFEFGRLNVCIVMQPY